MLDGHRGEALGLGCLGCKGGELLHWPCRESLLLSLLFPSQVIPDSDAHRAGLQEGDQVLSVNDVDFQDIEHSKVSTPVAQLLEQGQDGDLCTYQLLPASRAAPTQLLAPHN